MRSLVTFDLVGPMAHFRKFYTNSSSLSYKIPPRTVLTGILAALLGRERDSYYDDLSMEHARIGVSLETPVRSYMQTVNYLFTKNEGWDGCRGHTQIPVEFVLPSCPLKLIRYKVHFAHVNEEFTQELAEQLLASRYKYPIYLGLSECPAWIESPKLYENNELQIFPSSGERFFIKTALAISRLSGDLKLREGIRLYKDRMPFDLYSDRQIKAVDDVIWEENGRALEVPVNGEVFKLQDHDHFGVFLEFHQ